MYYTHRIHGISQLSLSIFVSQKIMGRSKNQASKNKYAHLHKQVPDLPRDVIDYIVMGCGLDARTMTRCKCVDKRFDASIGDLRTHADISKELMVDIVGRLGGSSSANHFNLSINSGGWRVTLIGQQAPTIKMMVIKKGIGSKVIQRCFPKSGLVEGLRHVFNRSTVFKGSNVPSRELFDTIFDDVRAVNLVCGDKKPDAFYAWRDHVRKRRQP
jgi:hypothetical protein